MKLFELVEKRVILNEHVLLIPEFKAIVDTYPDHFLDVFCYIYYFCDYKSPFSDYEPDKREEKLMEMYNKDGAFTLEDQVIIRAIQFYNEAQWTPTMELLESTKAIIFKLASYLKTADITEGRDGNLTQIVATIKQIGPTISSYDELREQVEKEKEKTVIRGGKTISARER